MAMIELNATTFETVIAQGTVLVSWYRSGWAPWQAFAPIYQEAAQRHPTVTFARVDAEREHQLARWCGVDEIPTLMAFCNGVLVLARVGFDVAESLDLLVRRLKWRSRAAARV